MWPSKCSFGYIISQLFFVILYAKLREKVLSQCLKQLTIDGLIRRELFPDVPPRVEYSVTDFGKTLLPHVEALMKWGQDNFEQIMLNRHNNI
ncbi:MAG: winged helix-turn-helix transcriptional regulator [Muribaculaceae bacterium]|nr:winged helix-turn-helix transcriptional regulator [Muribaculaceae bacterium]